MPFFSLVFRAERLHAPKQHCENQQSVLNADFSVLASFPLRIIMYSFTGDARRRLHFALFGLVVFVRYLYRPPNICHVKK
mmetsp:Transcript_11909/g.17187  ORF Transcript_11909/g.17187 Transcript_11909/m.17187 type:complete len:80 (-) Transcript_11909:155-394(-)